jgi:hypothetical protein
VNLISASYLKTLIANRIYPRPSATIPIHGFGAVYLNTKRPVFVLRQFFDADSS